ncbi:filamin-B-like [Sinocyclocheilus grahami]|uniref:filamin-B-like n=1 Tax=Sinocyclocheilus grahami TaxID=75366 RepID=UPI0007ACA7BE|nr:PREDICTED: filamin-B-like [Sinocyclocheilus grahami]
MHSGLKVRKMERIGWRTNFVRHAWRSSLVRDLHRHFLKDGIFSPETVGGAFFIHTHIWTRVERLSVIVRFGAQTFHCLEGQPCSEMGHAWRSSLVRDLHRHFLKDGIFSPETVGGAFFIHTHIWTRVERLSVIVRFGAQTFHCLEGQPCSEMGENSQLNKHEKSVCDSRRSAGGCQMPYLHAMQTVAGAVQVIAPEEIIDPSVDEQSVMTYLSQFPKSKLKPGAPLKPKLNPKKARAYGPGIEPTGNRVMRPAVFTVDTFSAGQGQVTVYVEDPEGRREEVRPVLNEGKKTYSVTYIPQVMGPHKVTVLFAGQQIIKSPFEVVVDKAQGDATKVTAKGPGLEPLGNIANKPTFFDIYTAGAGVGDVTAVIKDPLGNKNTVEAIMEDKGESVFRCTYKPMQAGPHTINITFGGIAIPKSPFTVNIGPAAVPGACRASGRGLQPRGVRVRQVADFKVDTRNAGSGDLKATVKGPKGLEEPVKQKDASDGVYSYEYYPHTPGKYTVSITWAGQHIPKSAFEVQVGPEAGPQKIRAWGPGLEGGVVGKSADFVAESIGTDVGVLGEITGVL